VPLRYGGCVGQEFYDKFNIPVRGHSRQIIWKDVWILTDDRDVFQLDPFYSIGTGVIALPLWKIENSRLIVG
jgi:hypothetical protein